MDRSLTYFDDVAAIKVSLHLMQKRSGVPLLRFTSTFEVPPSIPFTPTADIHAGSEAHIRELGRRTSMKALYESYTIWCENSSLDPLPNTSFGKELGRQGFEVIKTNRGNDRKGIVLREQPDMLKQPSIS